MRKPFNSKSDPMIRAITNLFPERVAAIKEGKCPICKKLVDRRELRTTFSEKEYYISGMCQNCQDMVFKESDHDT